MIKTKDFTPNESIDLMEEISLVAPTDTPLISYLLSKGNHDKVTSTVASWREKTLDNSSTDIEEGADATSFVSSKRKENHNICQIFHKGVSVSGTAQATGVHGINDLMADELEDRLTEIKVQMERAVLTGEKDDGSSSGVRKMEGLSNFVTKENTVSRVKLDEKAIKETVKKLWDNGLGSNEFVAVVNADLKEEIDEIYKDRYFYVAEHNEMGLVVTKIQTNYGVVNLLLDRHCPEDEVIIADMDYVRLGFLREPVMEELGKTGDNIKSQVVSELTLKVLNENAVSKFKLAGTK